MIRYLPKSITSIPDTETLSGCSYGVHFLGIRVVGALLLGVYKSAPLILGNSQKGTLHLECPLSARSQGFPDLPKAAAKAPAASAFWTTELDLASSHYVSLGKSSL